MNYTIRFAEDSLKDFEKGNRYYENNSKELANKFHHSFLEKINEIEKNPLHFQIRYRNIRIANMKQFPFSIHFIIDNKIIFVFKVLHQKRLYK